MNDRNDTIEYLKYLRDRAVISGSTITEPSDLITRLCDEVLELLKEQEPRVLTLEEEPIKVERHMEETEWNVCGNCGSHVIHKWAYCPYCGKRLKWDE